LPRQSVPRKSLEMHRRETPAQSQTRPTPIPFIGFAISALAPSAAIVKAVKQMVLAASGNDSKSLSAALIQETARVCLVIRFSLCRDVPAQFKCGRQGTYVVILDNILSMV
jgi:hypothetical protein